jgi:hypothetical protein
MKKLCRIVKWMKNSINSIKKERRLKWIKSKKK